MRTDWMVGLNVRGKKIIQGARIIRHETFAGAWNEMSTTIYRLRNGKVVEEYVQCEPWSSGPNYFLALRDGRTKEIITESLWDYDSEIGI